jgi:hypothetical protein
MEDSRNNSLLDATKHLVTLAMAALGLLVTIMFTSLGGEPLVRATPYKNSLQTALVAFLACVALGFLVQASVLSRALGEKPRLVDVRPTVLLGLAWTAFVVGMVAFFVFAWATTFGVAPLGF